MMKRPYGFAPSAFEAYLQACAEAKIAPYRVTQTIGNAPASAGYHAKDGEENGAPYCAATDLSDNGLSHAQIRKWLDRLAAHGFAGWFRNWEGNTHIHVVYAALDMKSQLFLQVVDFLNDRNGLKGHAKEKFYAAPPEYDRLIARGLKAKNPMLWAAHEERIPKAYRKDIPARLFVNGQQVKEAYLAGGSWYCPEGALSEILGGTTMTPSLLAPVAALLKRWGWRNEKYTPNFAAQNRADLRVVQI
jgi:hypothetical protein